MVLSVFQIFEIYYICDFELIFLGRNFVLLFFVFIGMFWYYLFFYYIYVCLLYVVENIVEEIVFQMMLYLVVNWIYVVIQWQDREK